MNILIAYILFTLAWIPIYIGNINNWLKYLIRSIIFGLIIGGITIYFLMPPTLSIVIIPIFLFMLILNCILRYQAAPYYAPYYGEREKEKVIDEKDIYFIIGTISIILLVIFLVIFLFAVPYYAKELHSIPKMKNDNITADKISIEHIRTVPKETAEWKADKKVGELGYKFEIRDAHIQFRDGELKWLVPLEYGGLWKAYKYGEEGTSGYIKVSAEHAYKEAERILGYNLKYISSGVFGYNLKRNIYFSFPDKYIKESVFQLDDKGLPIYVTMLTTPTIAYTGEKPVGIVITDPSNGENKFYEMDNIPSHIQRAMDESLTERYLTWWGKYVHGFWNSLFSQRDVKGPTGGLYAYQSESGEIRIDQSDPDIFLIYGGDDKLYWFTSMTTSGKDLSMVGYTLTDTITGDTIFYKTEGYFNDIGAAKNVQQHAEVSKVMGFRVSQPIMYIIEGNETWIIPVLASTNEIRAFGIVHGKTGTTFVNNNLNDVISEYKKWLLGKEERKEIREEEDNIIGKIIIKKGDKEQEIPIYRNSSVTISYY